MLPYLTSSLSNTLSLIKKERGRLLLAYEGSRFEEREDFQTFITHEGFNWQLHRLYRRADAAAGRILEHQRNVAEYG